MIQVSRLNFISRLLNYACVSQVSVPTAEVLLNNEISWLKKVRDSVLKTGECQVSITFVVVLWKKFSNHNIFWEITINWTYIYMQIKLNLPWYDRPHSINLKCWLQSCQLLLFLLKYYSFERLFLIQNSFYNWNGQNL